MKKKLKVIIPIIIIFLLSVFMLTERGRHLLSLTGIVPEKEVPPLVIDPENLISPLLNPVDNAILILIPAGEFIMGAPQEDKEADEDEFPQRRVFLPDYYIYKYEVTNNQYSKFIQATGYKGEGEWKLFYNAFSGNHPVIEVSFRDAQEYACWAGGGLPTEAEWEKAARGDDGLIYPWGNQWNPDYCNNKDMQAHRDKIARLEKHDGIWYGTLPVGTFPQGQSPYGVMDMAGNAAEWCLDWYDENYHKDTLTGYVKTSSKGKGRVLRGGSFFDGKYLMRCSSRDEDDPEKWCNLYGFRVVIPIKPKAQ